MRLMLHPAWPGTFRRTVRHEDQPGVVYNFEPNDPIDVPECDLEGLAGDIGKALVIPKGQTSKPDYDATALAAADFEAYVANHSDIEVDATAEPVSFDESAEDASDELPPATEPAPEQVDDQVEEAAEPSQVDELLASVDEPAAEPEPEIRSGKRKKR